MSRSFARLNVAATAAVVALLIAGPARAHEPYAGWKENGTGASCCSTRDCRRVELCDNGEGFLTLFGRCDPIPRDTLIRQPSPDGYAHVCVRNGQVVCAVKPPGA
jgi:hypothetical protein